MIIAPKIGLALTFPFCERRFLFIPYKIESAILQAVHFDHLFGLAHFLPSFGDSFETFSNPRFKYVVTDTYLVSHYFKDTTRK